MTSARVIRTYLTLMLLSTLASSFIWGINTLFLLDAGLSVTEAFIANAFFTLGQMIFEIPTGVLADTVGRRASYLLGAATLLVSTLGYLIAWHLRAPLWGFALASVVLGLGFTFFSGATEAWLVDALHATGYTGSLDRVFARGQIALGIAMLTGTLSGGLVAQATNLGVPYLLRIAALGLTFGIAFVLMKDVGFTPARGVTVLAQAKAIARDSFVHGMRNAPVRWIILAGPFGMGVSIYAFYAMQPFLLELYGRESYAIAGIAATIVAGAQIAGGLLVPLSRRIFARRTSLLAVGGVASAAALAVIGLLPHFWVAIAMLVAWTMVFAMSSPVRQAYLNGLIPSEQRATVLSADSFVSSAGGAIFQPALARIADVAGYAISYVVCAALQLLMLPFILLARRERSPSDPLPPAGQ